MQSSKLLDAMLAGLFMSGYSPRRFVHRSFFSVLNETGLAEWSKLTSRLRCTRECVQASCSKPGTLLACSKITN